MHANAPLSAARSATLRRTVAVAGPGALVAVGYVDPGNWATDIAGGSRYAYALLSVVFACSLVAMLFQIMSARLGLATGRDLATLTREMRPGAAWIMWAGAELAVIATDLAEVLGSALALELIFGVPLLVGVLLTALDVGVLFAMDRAGTRWLDRFVASLVVIVGAGLGYELLLARFDVKAALAGLVPRPELARDPEMLLMAVGILGATVMPHNLYLHSSLVLAHRTGRARADARRATTDTVTSLGAAMMLNAALVVLAASVFHASGREDVASIEDAHRLLAPLLGSTLAPLVFALALLAAGQSATITGTMAGQVIMSGLLELRWPAWQRRLATRACAIVPAVVVLAWSGEGSTSRLLVVSQVVLSIQLPFALVPLMCLTSDERRMGELVNTTWMKVAGWTSVTVIVVANAALLSTASGCTPSAAVADGSRARPSASAVPSGAPPSRSPPHLPLTLVADVPLPGGATRFDYADIDAAHGHLVFAHMNDASVVVADLATGAPKKVIANVPTARGVIVAPEVNRIFVTCAPDRVVAIDATSLAEVARIRTGNAPDGIAWDAPHRTIGVSDQRDGALSLIADAGQGKRVQLPLGKETGNVVYDGPRGVFWITVVAASPPDQVVAVDPLAAKATMRIPLPGCEGAHGLRIHPDGKSALVACEDNDTLARVDLEGAHALVTAKTGSGPDVLAVDPGLGWIYVAAESGDLSVFDVARPGLSLVGRAHPADHAHSVAVDPVTHRVFFPLQAGPHGSPVLRIMKPTQ